LLVGLLLLPRLALFAQFTGSVLAWPWQFDYDEGVNLHAAWLLAHGTNIYAANPPDRFISAPYPPVLYMLSAPALLLGGLHLVVPRLLVLAATLIIGALLGYLAHKEGAGLPASALVAALWFSISPVIIWGALYKQDMLALAFGLGGLAVLYCSPDRSPYLALALFALAFFTKQSALAPAAAGLAWLFLRDRWAGLRFGWRLLVALGGGFLLLLALSGGGFWQHALVYQEYPWLPSTWQRVIGKLVGEYTPLLLLGGGVVALALIELARRLRTEGRRWASLELPLPVVYVGAATGSVMIQAGYSGANYNHLLDIFPPLLWLVGYGLARTREARTWTQAACAAAIFGLLLVQVPMFGGLEHWYTSGYWPSPSRDGELRGRSALVAAARGDIFSEDDTLMLLAGREPVYDDPDTIATMGDSGGWDESRLVQDLRDRRFPLIMVRHGAYRWSTKTGAAFGESYEPTFLGTLDVYRPRIYPQAAQYTLDCDLGAPPELRLVGYSLGPGVAHDGIAHGETLRLAYQWHVLRQAGDYATFVHLLDASGKTVAARDNPQSAAGRPTSSWSPGTDLTEVTDLPLPSSLAPGSYRLIGGMYGVAAGKLMPVAVGCPAAEHRYGDAVALGMISVR